MDKGLYIAMTAAKHNLHAQAVHANNLANVSTNAFQRDFVDIRSMPIYYGEGQPARVYALAERPKTDLSQGPIVETGNDLDVTVNDKGWIAIQTPEGGEAFVKSASMLVDPLGQLRTSAGQLVLGSGGPIAIPPQQKIEIGSDGTITVRGAGQGPETLAALDRIKLVNPADDDLKKNQQGFIVRKDGLISLPDAGIAITSGFVSGSNTNAVAAMTEMISQSRQYEMSVKMMKTFKETNASTSRLMKIS